MVEPPDGAHALAGPARDAEFLIEGERASVHGSQCGALRAIRIGTRIVAANVSSSLGAAANLITLPGLARRELVGSTGTCIESVVVAPTLPFVAVQWARPAAAEPTRVSLDLLPGNRAVRYRAGSASVTTRGDDDDLVAVGVIPAPERFELEDRGGDGVRVTAQVSGPGPVTLVIAAGPAGTIRSCFGAVAHLGAHARGAADFGLEAGLRLSTDSPELDDGILWARVRLRGALARAASTGSAGPSDVLAAGIAASGVGDRESARRAHDLIEGAHPAGAALLAGRLASVFGDAGPALSHARTALEAPRKNLGAGDRELSALALEHLADGLRYSTSESLIAELRDAARSLGGVRLPVVGGGAPSAPRSSWVASLLEGEPSAPPNTDGGDRDRMRRVCADFRTDPDAAWAAWRGAAAAGLTDGPSGPGSWDPTDPGGPSASPITSALLSVLAYGLLGLVPDAPSGRIRIAPRLPSHLARLDADGITVGDTRLTLRYRREDRRHLFELEPELGSVPPLAVFEPAVAGPVREVRVDGAPALLEVRHSGVRTVVPVQLPVDGRRTLEILTE